MGNKNNEINDESLLEDLFEDFGDKKKDKKTTQPETGSNTMKKIVIALLLSLVVLGGYIYFITPNDSIIENNEQTNHLQDTNIQNDNTVIDVTEVSQVTEVIEAKDYEAVNKKEYNEFSFLFIDKSFVNNAKTNFTNVWGEENIIQGVEGSLQVTYPKGSYKPSANPRGGAGFIYNIDQAVNNLTLSYDIELADNFDFVKGGKLPGLCGGDCARGGMSAQDGFSTRFAWKKDGELDILRSFPNAGQFGEYADKKIFTLEAGKKYTLSQSLTLNTPGKSNGKLAISVNGKIVYIKDDLVYRIDDTVNIDAILFSTFFGGSDETWATPVDTSIVFSNFKIQ